MDGDTEFGRELIASLEDAVGIVRGNLEPARVHLPADAIDVRVIREAMGLSRPAFAQRFGLAVTAVRDWEQGLRRPDAAVRVLLKVIERNPEVPAEKVAEISTAWPSIFYANRQWFATYRGTRRLENSREP